MLVNSMAPSIYDELRKRPKATYWTMPDAKMADWVRYLPPHLLEGGWKLSWEDAAVEPEAIIALIARIGGGRGFFSARWSGDGMCQGEIGFLTPGADAIEALRRWGAELGIATRLDKVNLPRHLERFGDGPACEISPGGRGASQAVAIMRTYRRELGGTFGEDGAVKIALGDRAGPEGKLTEQRLRLVGGQTS
jgi:hypothetical protein